MQTAPTCSEPAAHSPVRKLKMIIPRAPVTLEQRQRRQRFWQHFRQLSLMLAFGAAFAVGIFVGAQP